MSTLERIWLAYLGAVLAVALTADGGGSSQHRPGLFVLVHALLLAVQLLLAWLARRVPAPRLRIARALASCIGCPVTFSSLMWLLPAVQPEPWEFVWLDVDRALFGGDLGARLLAALPDWVVLLLQLIYLSFYLLPIGAGLLVAKVRGGAAFDRAMTILAGSFLASYLGYLLFPTLAPRIVLAAGGDVHGDGLAALLRHWVDVAEVNMYDCFPSGHTMLALTSSIVVWRWARRWLPLFLLVALPLIASTVCLRYHWPIDVVVGAALAWPAVRVCDLLLDRDGAPPA